MFYFIYFLITLSFLDMFSQLPIMSTFALDLGAKSAIIGFIVGAYSFSNMISNVISGYFIDRHGSKIIIMIGLFLTGGILFLYPEAINPYQLLLIRLAHGICAGFLVPAAYTYMSQLKTEKSGKIMALSGAAIGFAAIVGPAFGGIITKFYGAEWVFWSIGSLMLLSGLLSIIVLKTKDFVPNPNKELEPSGKSILELFKIRGLLFAYLGALSLMFSQGILAYMLPLKVDALNFDSHISGLLLSTFGIVAILFFVLPTNRIYDKFKNELLMIDGLSIMAIALVFLSFISNKILLFLIMALYGIGFALLFPSISSLISKNSRKEDRGKAYGLFYAFFSLGVVVGSSLTGALSMSPYQAFITGGIFLSLSTMLILFLYRKKATSVKNELS